MRRVVRRPAHSRSGQLARRSRQLSAPRPPGWRRGRLSLLALQAFAQFARAAPILERLAAVDEKHRDLDSELRLEFWRAVDFHASEGRVEARPNFLNHHFHFVTQLTVAAGIENQIHTI